MTSTERTNLKMLWFARWLASCYDGTGAMTIENGKWYAEQLGHFNRVVYKRWLKQSKANGAKDFKTYLKYINEA